MEKKRKIEFAIVAVLIVCCFISCTSSNEELTSEDETSKEVVNEDSLISELVEDVVTEYVNSIDTISEYQSNPVFVINKSGILSTDYLSFSEISEQTFKNYKRNYNFKLESVSSDELFSVSTKDLIIRFDEDAETKSTKRSYTNYGYIKELSWYMVARSSKVHQTMLIDSNTSKINLFDSDYYDNSFDQFYLSKNNLNFATVTNDYLNQEGYNIQIYDTALNISINYRSDKDIISDLVWIDDENLAIKSYENIEDNGLVDSLKQATYHKIKINNIVNIIASNAKLKGSEIFTQNVQFNDINPYYYGDFFGDGIEDLVFLVKNGEDRVNVVFVDNTKSKYKIRIIGGEEDSFEMLDYSWVGQFNKVGRGANLWSNYVDDFREYSEVPKNEIVNLNYDAIFLHALESCGGGFVYWKDNGFHWLQQE